MIEWYTKCGITKKIYKLNLFLPNKKMVTQKSKSIASMILGICSMVLCWTGPIAFVSGITAIVFSSKGLSSKGQGKGMAIAGLVTGIIGTIFSFFYSLIWILVIFTYP